jgi:hypothetical protein
MIIKISPSVSYSMWLKRILDTHTSQAWNAEPTDVREREDEELNDLWTEIDDGQKQRLWGLSSDLNSLRDREAWVESDWPTMSKEELGRAQADAFQRKEWDKLLEYLRRPPRFHPQNMVDYLRGRAWMEMGHPEVALLFFDNASRLEPGNSSYGVLALECLKVMLDWPEVLKRCQAYLQDPATPAPLLFRAADALHVYADQTGEQQYFHEAIRAIDVGFGQLDQAGEQAKLHSILSVAYATKSLCLERLGRVSDALQVIDEAVQHFPENTTLLTARGLLKQELGIANAVDDFRHAVACGTPVVWSYIELARYELQNGSNQDAVEMCRRGMALAPRANAAGILFQLLAIALLRLNHSLDAVRAAFQRAGDLDPLSEEIRSNREQFESYAANPHGGEPQWQLASTAPRFAMDDVCAQMQPAA